MPIKRFFKRYTPERHHLEKHGKLHLFGDQLHDPNLWHMTRRSTPGGVANGLFWAFMPLPGQTFFVILSALFFRVNLPVSVLFAWLTNPLTFYPLFYAAYKTGSFLINEPPEKVNFELSWQWVTTVLGDIWLPLTLGCLTLGLMSAICGYYFIRWLWRFSAIRKWEERREKNLLKKRIDRQKE